MITIKKSEYNKAKLRKLFREASQQYIQITDEEAQELGLIEQTPINPTGEQESQVQTIIGTWKGKMSINNGINVSYVDSEITFTDNNEVIGIWNGIWVDYYDSDNYKDVHCFNWNVDNTIIYINFDDNVNCEIRDYTLMTNRFCGRFWDGDNEITFELQSSPRKGYQDYYEYYYCRFMFDSTLHPLPCQLTAALSSNGTFMKIETSVEQGVRHLKTTRNYDNTIEDIRLSTSRENQYYYALGANNCIIVGVSSYDNTLVAYEGQCPNCLKDSDDHRHPLTWINNGTQLYCNECKRTYDVNNGIVVNGTPGIALYRYKAALDGGILRTWS